MLALKVIYLANIIVAGWVGITSLFFPKTAVRSIFAALYPESDAIRLIGCLWLSIAILSVFGLWKPVQFSPVLILQFLYKGGWLLIVALPAVLNSKPYPKELAVFFIIWVLILPVFVPWKQLLSS